MFRALRHLPAALRITLVMFLVLGTVARSGLQLVAELHGAEHAVHAALADHDHEHDGSDVPAPGEPAIKHGLGSHGLLHLDDCITFAVVSSAIDDSKSTLRAVNPPALVSSAVVTTTPATPFRPPIA